MALCNITDVETLFQRSFDSNAEEDTLDAMLVAAEAEVLSYLDRIVELQTGYEEILHVLRPDHRLFAHERIDDNLIVEEKTPGGIYTPLTVNDEYVLVDQASGQLHRIYSERAQRTWAVGYNTVRLTYDAGWATPPAIMCQVIAEIAYARWMFHAKQGEGELVAGALTSERMGDYQIRYGDVRASAGEQSLAGGGIGISQQHRRMLAPFRRRHVA